MDKSLPVSFAMGFLRQEYYSGLLFLSPGNLPDPGIEPASPALAGEFFTTAPPGKTKCVYVRGSTGGASLVYSF